jgi:hypothetical protein
VAQIATANTLAQERARVLVKRVAKAEQILLAKQQQLQETQAKLRAAQASYTKLTHVAQQLAVYWVQGEKPGEPVVAFAEQVREQARRRLEQAAAEVLQGPVRSPAELEVALQAKGYALGVDSQQCWEITCLTTGTRVPHDQVRPNGRDFQKELEAAIARTLTQEHRQNQRKSITR